VVVFGENVNEIWSSIKDEESYPLAEPASAVISIQCAVFGTECQGISDIKRLCLGYALQRLYSEYRGN
jgi:hypothetical protein